MCKVFPTVRWYPGSNCLASFYIVPRRNFKLDKDKQILFRINCSIGTGILIGVTRTNIICLCNYDLVEIINGDSTIKHIRAAVTAMV
jgi:hypothetical protein